MGCTKNPALRAGFHLKKLSFELGRRYIRGRRSLRGLLQLELHLLAFRQALEAGTLNRGMMYEHILATVFRGNKAKAFSVVTTSMFL